MKKFSSLLLAFAFASTVYTGSVSAAPGITVKIAGYTQSYEQSPVLINGTTMVPMRAIFESLGAEVKWDAENQIVGAFKNGAEIYLAIGESEALRVFGEEELVQPLAQPPQLINGRTMVPLRFVSEALGAEVTWDGATQTVQITAAEQRLHKAIANKEEELFYTLLVCGVNVDAVNEEGTPALFAAVDASHHDIMQAMLESGADPANPDRNGNTALLHAAEIGNVFMAQMLLEAGANYRVQNAQGETPLVVAKRLGHEEVIDLLTGPATMTPEDVLTDIQSLEVFAMKDRFSVEPVEEMTYPGHALAANEQAVRFQLLNAYKYFDYNFTDAQKREVIYNLFQAELAKDDQYDTYYILIKFGNDSATEFGAKVTKDMKSSREIELVDRSEGK